MTQRSWGSKALLPVFKKLWPEIKVAQLGSVGKVQIWTIHGEKLRDYTDDKGGHPFIDFTEGGNWQAYPWLPDHLIIIDADATRNEIELTKLHELHEANEMESAGDNYDVGRHPAHQSANKVEGKARTNPSQYPELFKQEADRRAKMDGVNDDGDQPDDIISATIQRIESQLTPDNKVDCDKIVVSGLHVALKGGPQSLAAQMAKSKDPVDMAIRGAANMVLIQRRATAQGTMPGKAMVPAATILMLKALQFSERAGAIKVDAQMIAQATRKLSDYLMRSLGLPPQRLKAAAGKMHDIMSDPQKMAKIHAAAGSTPDVRKALY